MKKLFIALTSIMAVLLLCPWVAYAAEGDEVALPSPVIYGDFNEWAIEGEDAKPLTETEAGSGIFKGTYAFDAYTGEDDGYTVIVCVTKVDYGEYGWGAGEQYTLSGETAGFGSTSFFAPEVTGMYEFTYDSSTNITTVILMEVDLPSPVIYGDFNEWAIEGEDAKPLTETEAGSGIFKGTYAFDAYTGDGDGYTVIVCVSKMNYGEYGWGAGTQYTLDGEAAGFGSTSFFAPEVAGQYEFTYDSSTNITTVILMEVDLPSPVIYGDFNEWAIEGEDAKPLTETEAGSGIFKGTYAFDAYTGDGDGYTVIVCVSKMNYGEYGWGAGTQYTLSGEAAGFGSTSFFAPEVTGQYEFTYDSSTNITTFTLLESESPQTSDAGAVAYIAGLLGASIAVLKTRKTSK